MSWKPRRWCAKPPPSTTTKIWTRSLSLKVLACCLVVRLTPVRRRQHHHGSCRLVGRIEFRSQMLRRALWKQVAQSLSQTHGQNPRRCSDVYYRLTARRGSAVNSNSRERRRDGGVLGLCPQHSSW